MRVQYLVAFCVLSQLAAPPVAVAQQDSPPSDATSAITCIQTALGGTAAFSAVSSLYVRSETKPLQTSGMRPIPGTREVSVVFPDRYLLAHLPSRPQDSPLSSKTGFDKGVILSSPRHPDAKRAEILARQSFALQMLMRLPGKRAGVTLVLRLIGDSRPDQLAIQASGADSFRATLLVDRGTCVPIALQTPSTGAVGGVRRIDLSEYRPFGGLRFPTLLRTSVAGEPYLEERVASIEVNTPTAARAFAGRR